MSESHSTPATPAAKPARPAKPNPNFPLFAHASGQWAKKIRGRMHYFGGWSDPDGALEKYLDQRDALHSGRKPRPATEAVTVKDVVNAFLNAKQSLVEAGELSPKTFAEYKGMSDELVDHLGKGRLVSDLDPADFASLRVKLAKRWGPHRLGKGVQTVRSIFKHARESGLTTTAVLLGPGFKRPSKKTIRLHRAEQGPKLFTAAEVRLLLAHATPAMRAMVLLAINCGLGNSDCGNLPLTAVDLDRGWLDYPRPKTGVQRRSHLWPETVQALRDFLAVRPEPKDTSDAGLVFITKQGHPWAKSSATGTNPTSAEMAKLLRSAGLAGRAGLSFYALRHTFRTVADEAKDQPAADYLMGHESSHMSSHYRERISDARLKAVTDHVRFWLFGEGSEQ